MTDLSDSLGRSRPTPTLEVPVGLVIAILLVALVIGILSVVVKGLLWLLFIALLLAVGAFVLSRLRGGSRRTGDARL